MLFGSALMGLIPPTPLNKGGTEGGIKFPL